jgi:HD-like signal output (HDOD) protein
VGAQPVTVQESSAQSLPIFAYTARSFRRALSDSVTNWKSIGNIILKDPGLILQTLRQLQSGYKPSTSPDVSGISQALMLMGFDRMRQLILGVPVLEKSVTKKSLTGYNRAVNRAYHAAYQARNWAQWRNDFAPEEVFLATMLHSVPELVLWVNEADKIQQLRRQIYKDGMSAQEAEQLTLGQSLQQIGLKVMCDMRLPDFVCDVFDDAKASLPRMQMVNLAVQLANMVEFGWHTEHVTGIIGAIAGYLNKHPEHTARIVQQNAINAARDLTFSVTPPAASLLALIPSDDDRLLLEQFPDELESQQHSTVSDKKSTSAQPSEIQPVRQSGEIIIEQAAERSHARQQAGTGKTSTSSVVCLSPQPALLARAIKELEAGKGKLADDEVIKIAVEGMRNGIGFHRVVFAVPSSNGLYLEACKIIGSEYDAAFNMFKIKLDKLNLFSRLLEKPSSIWINDENRGKYWRSIPSEFKVLIKINSFCAMSVCLDGKPVGLFYVDQCSPECKIDKQAFTLFRHLGLLAARCLTEQSAPAK